MKAVPERSEETTTFKLEKTREVTELINSDAGYDFMLPCLS